MRGQITYDPDHGHVCTCAETEPILDTEGNPVMSNYDRTVSVSQDIEPTQGGSYWYACSRCGVGAWSGC